MASVSLICKKMSNTKLKLSDLNPHLMCVLCGGYYIDATTIVECLHSFCRSCIVKHLESSKYCPICEVQVHKTKPLINIRPDKTLQDIVYKLVPGLFANEMRSRRKFYKERPHYIKPHDSESAGEVSGERKIYINDENITFSLVYHEGPGPTSVDDSYYEFSPPANNERRYFKCPTGVTIQHLKKLLKAKYELSDNNYKLEIYFRDQELHQDFTLLDIAYIYLWKTKGTLDLTYKIFGSVVKRQKIQEKRENAVVVLETPKQIEISIPESKATETVEEKEREENVEKEGENVNNEKKAEIMDTVEDLRPEVVPKEQKVNESDSVKQSETEPVKENGVIDNEVKEVQLQISESGVMSVSQVEDSEIVKTVEETATKVTKSQVVKSVPVKETKPGNTGNGEVKRPEKKPATKPFKPYRTIRCSPKTWHPVIPREKLRPTLIKNSDEPRKPLKFFKMRNMPRFLGNPSGGVKPIFAEAAEKPAEEKKPDAAAAAGKTLNKILKIDPKTLRPIEKEEMKISSTPSAPNLLTNPFIPNNNHFLFSDLHLLPPNSGNYKDKPTTASLFKAPIPNGSYPPICFPTPEHSPPGFYPFSNLTKPQAFSFPPRDKMDPLLRASRLSPFGNLTGFNVAGFHASLPPSISRLLNPHHHFRKINQTLERKNQDESTKETTKRCDDSLKVSKATEEEERAEKKDENEEEKKKKKSVTEGNKKGERVTMTTTTTTTTTTTSTTTATTTTTATSTTTTTVTRSMTKEGEVGKEGRVNGGEPIESASDLKLDSSASVGEKERDKDKDR